MLYNIFFMLFAIAYLPYMLIKRKARKDFSQRFGFLPEKFRGLGTRRPVWVHAVSVGEVLAAREFVNLLNKECKRPVILSTTTRTGSDLAKKTFGKDIPKFYFPVDLSWVINKVLNILNPGIFVVFETEIWPNLIKGLSKRKIPIVLVNGRISDSSYKGYKRISFLFKKVLRLIDVFCMQTELDKERIIDIGAEPGKVRVTGNMKFDTSAGAGMPEEEILKRLGISRGENLLVAGSTHVGEDGIVLDVYKELVNEFPNLRLLVAPRHIDRTEDIAGFSVDRKLAPVRVSRVAYETPGSMGRPIVLILDTIGELKEIFRAATVVFMGGSLVDKGGHNIVEPALYAKPVIFGPYMSNFRDMARIFLENSASLEVRDADSLKEAIRDLLKDEGKRRDMGCSAQELVARHKGATRRNLEEVLDRVR